MERLSTALVPLLVVACENPAFHNLPEIEPPNDVAGDHEPPTFDNAAVTPAAANDGARIALVFDASEALPSGVRAPASNPAVTVGGQAMTCAANGNSYSCTRDIEATAETEGTKSFLISAMDASGNEALGVDPGVTVVYDFTPPTLTVTSDLTRVAPGGTIVITVTSNEPLAAAPTLNTVFLGSISSCPTYDENLTFHCEGIVDLGASMGPSVVTATATDVAGNTATSPPLAVTISDQPPDTYTIGGTVTGLVGSGLVLRNNGGDNLAISADGAFSFVTALDDTAAYVVTVLVQPISPDQLCTVANGSGAVAGADVTDVAITCSTETFAVGVTVAGLVGSGLTLQNNGSDDLSIPSDGSYPFTTEIADGGAYVVTVLAQPTTPAQTCAVTGGIGTITGGPVNVAVVCATGAFTVGGDVSGLTGSGLVLQLNGTENLPVTADGSFTFLTPLPDLFVGYTVTVVTQPSSPTQNCTVADGSGNIAGADVTNVAVTCTTSTFTVGGTVIGLTGANLVLQNNSGDNLGITGTGDVPFTFATALDDDSDYDVTVFTQPTAQTCSVSAGSGTISGGNVTSVIINCQTGTYTIGGTVTGLSPLSTGLVLQNLAGNDLTVSAPGQYTFTTALADGAFYQVSILTQPTSPNQTCTITGVASGTVPSANVTNVDIDCTTTTYTVGGGVSGLMGSGLVLQNNGGDNLPVVGGFTFPAMDDGSAYAVTVLNHPTVPQQTCEVADGTGVLDGANVTNVAVTCTTDQFSLGGTVSGLDGTVVLRNGTEDLPVNTDGSFTFTQLLDDMASYSVSVTTQPTNPGQTCVVAFGAGAIDAGPVTNVTVTCTTDLHWIRGNVSGLAVGNSVILRNNGGNDETVSINGGFAFSTRFLDGSTYSITVGQQPTSPNQVCTVTNDTGTISGGDVIDVTVTCSTEQYSIGGVVTGLADGNEVVLRNNGGAGLTVSYTDGSDVGFTFPIELDDRALYNVSIVTEPTTPDQTCLLSFESGQVDGADVINVIVTCTIAQYTVGGTVNGLTSGTVVLQNNLGDDLSISATGMYAFPPQDDYTTYSVTVLTHPVGQSCSVANPTGQVDGGPVTDVFVTCSTSQYTVGGTVSGLATNNFVELHNDVNSGSYLDSHTPLADGLYSFPSTLMTNDTYDVFVFAQPTSPNQTCTVANPSGTITANVGNVDVTCVINQYTVGGTISGLTGSGLVLLNNSAPLPVSAGATDFTFPAQDDETTYAVTVSTQPVGQTCSVVANGSGALSGANITDITVTCSGLQFSVGGTVSGLQGVSGVTLQNMGTDDLTVIGDGSFTFLTLLNDNAPYDVTVSVQPTGPAQICTVGSESGNIPSANVTDVTVTCGADPPPTVTVAPPSGNPITNNQAIVFTFSEEVNPSSMVIDAVDSNLLAPGHNEGWNSPTNTVLTITPTTTWSVGAVQGIVFTIADLAGATADVVVVYDVINTSSIIHVDGGVASDAPGCGSTATPCKTIVYGLSRAVASGSDAVYVLAGTYDETRMCNGVETAVVLPPDVNLYGGFTTGFSLAARDPANYVTTIRAEGITGSPPPPVQFTAYDDQCDDNPVTPSAQAAVDGFRLENGNGSLALFADELGTLRSCEVAGDVDIVGTAAVLGANRINGQITATGAPWILWNDITTTGTAVSVSGSGTVAIIDGNLITVAGSGAIGVSVTGGGASEISDNDIDLTGASTALYGVRDTTGLTYIDGNTILGINGNASGGWGISGGDTVIYNDITLDGSAGDLYGIGGSFYCANNTIIAAAASGTSYGLSGCDEAWNNVVRMSGATGFDYGIDDTDTASFNHITIDSGVAIRVAGADVSVSSNIIYATDGTGIAFASAPTTYSVVGNRIDEPDIGIELTSGTGDASSNEIYDCITAGIVNVGSTGTMTADNNTITLTASATGVFQSQTTATLTAIVTGNTISGGIGGIALTATNGSHEVRDNLISVDRTGTTMANGNYGIRFSNSAGGVIEDNRIGFPQVGVWLDDDDDATVVRNNLVTGRWAVVITNGAGGTHVHDLYNNTLVGRVGVYLDGGLDIDLLNNIIAGADSAEHGIYVNVSAATPTTVANNDIEGVPTVYRSATPGDCTVPNECTLTEMETALSMSGNVEMDPLFFRFGGTDGDPTTVPLLEGDSYILTGSSPCEVIEGGRDGSSWGFSDDLAGTARTASLTCSPTNAGAAGWSMGAYER